MNTLSIAVKNIKNFITKNTAVFSIMLIALTISTITILYVVVKLDTLSDDVSAGDLSLNQISLKNTENQLAINDISDRLQSYYENNNSVIYVCGNIDCQDGYMVSFITDEEKNLQNFAEQKKPLSGKFFSDKDIENGNNVMISVGLGKELQSVKIGDMDIKVIGNYTSDGVSNGYIPKKTMLNNNIIPSEYKITYNHDLTAKETKKYKSQLEELFPEFKIEAGMDYILDNAPIMLDFENICLILMVVVAIFSCAYLYSYVIQMRIKEIYIFKICGSSSIKLIGIFLYELLFILIIQFALAFVIFKLCLMQALKKYDVAFTYGYSWYHTLIAFTIIVILSLIIFVPVLLYYCKKSAIKIKQKG